MKEQTVYINQPHLENLKHIELIRGLLFHEALCAIGWNDDNYMISSSLGAIDRMIRAAQGNSTELSKIHSFLKYPNFLTAFRVQLARHTDNQRFQSPGNLMLADGGSVTGVGGGGDGFGWYLKSLLFDNFYSFYSICSKAKSTSTIPYPGLKSELNKFELYLNCSEPQLYTWWSYFLSLSIETGYFRQGDASILTVAEFPWMGSIIIEEMQKPKSRFDHSKIKLTFNSLRWMAFDADEWVRTGSGVFLTLITKYYPLYPMSVAASPASATEVNPFHQTSNSKLLNPVLEVRGEQNYVENYFKIYKYAAIKRCTRERTRADSDLSFSYNPVSTEEYLRQRSAISEADLTKPPHCAVVLD